MTEFEPMDARTPKDSCVVIYWGEQKLNKGDERFVGSTYGVGTLEGIVREEPDRKAIALSVPGTAYVDAPF